MRTKILTLIGCLFLVAGSLLAYLLGATAVFDVRAARTWAETPCRVLTSEVVQVGEGTAVAIEFEYEFDRARYRSSRYQFVPFFSDDSALHKKIVRRLPAGTTTSCFVDPSEPASAVLDREFPARGRWLLIPAGIAGVGLVILLVLTVRRLTSRQRTE